MQNSMVMLTCSVLEREYPISASLFRKLKIVRLFLNLVSSSNMQNSMVLLKFSAFDRNFPFWVDWYKKPKLSF